MSLREKAREIKAAGEAERGNFDPQGKPLSLYLQWRDDRLRRRKDVPTRENFCHFWRVVAIWVPLMKVRHAASRVADHEWSGPALAIFLAVAVIVGLVTGSVLSTEFLKILLGTFAILYLVAGVFVGVLWSQTESDHDDIGVARLMGAIFFPTAVPFWFFGNIVKRVPDEVFDWILKGLLILGGGAFLVFICVQLFLSIGLWAIAVIIAVPAALVGAVFACVVLSDYIKGLQIRSETKAAAYDDEEDYTPREPKAPREPGKVSKFFSAIADFIVLIAQVVRTKKWKICPLVTIPEGPDEDNLVGAPEWS